MLLVLQYILCVNYATFLHEYLLKKKKKKLQIKINKKKKLCKTLTLCVANTCALCCCFCCGYTLLKIPQCLFFLQSTVSKSDSLNKQVLWSKASSLRVFPVKITIKSQAPMNFGINSDYWEWQSGTRGT